MGAEGQEEIRHRGIEERLGNRGTGGEDMRKETETRTEWHEETIRGKRGTVTR